MSKKSAIRSMSNDFKKFNFYKSSFDPATGTIVRSVEIPKTKSRWDDRGFPAFITKALQINPRSSEGEKLSTAWHRKYGRLTRIKREGETPYFYGNSHTWRSEKPFSPVPETIDVKITSWCNGPGGTLCDYCYMGSDPKGKHAPRELMETIFKGLKKAPYQIAFGGGEPTAHPDFPWFLQYTREQGTVPNYTTAGHIMRPEVIEATNLYCGGVALSYHAFKGPAWFKGIYDKWRRALEPHVQINVHLIVDDNVAENLLSLADIGLSDLNVVLLAYYPDVGRSDMSGLPSKGTYQVRLPKAIEQVTRDNGFEIAFSEGLLPYFLSHSLKQVDTRFAMQQEGLFSCYIDDNGSVSHSSFSPPDADSPNIYKQKLQRIWETLGINEGWPESYTLCESCKKADQCHVPVPAHFMLCNFADHNKTPAIDTAPRKRSLTVIT